MGSGRAMKRKLSALEGIYWCIMATFGSFFVAWALEKGQSQSFVSLMLMVYLLSGMAGQIVLSALCDRLRTNKKVFLAGVTAAALAQIGLYFFRSRLLFALCYALYGFSLGPMGSVLDAWIIRRLDRDMSAFTSVVGFGSISYALAVLVMGRLIRDLGYAVVPIVSSCAAVLTFILALTVPDGEFPQERGKGAALSLKDMRRVLGVPVFATAAAALFLSSMSSTPVCNFKIVLLESTGGDVATQGIDQFVSCAVQFAAFQVIARLRRFLAWSRLRASMLFVTAGIGIFCLASRWWTVIGGTVMIGVSYSLVVSSAREIALRSVDERLHTTAIGVLDAAYGFLGGAAAQAAAGPIAEGLGIKGLSLVCLAVSAVPIAILFLQKKKEYYDGGNEI